MSNGTSPKARDGRKEKYSVRVLVDERASEPSAPTAPPYRSGDNRRRGEARSPMHSMLPPAQRLIRSVWSTVTGKKIDRQGRHGSVQPGQGVQKDISGLD